MATLAPKLPSTIRHKCISDAADAKADTEALAAGSDILLVKGSHGSGAHKLAAPFYLRALSPPPNAAGGHDVT